MKLPSSGASKEPAPDGGDPARRVPHAWERAVRIVVVSGVIVSVTLRTGSAEDAVLAVTPLLPLLR